MLKWNGALWLGLALLLSSQSAWGQGRKYQWSMVSPLWGKQLPLPDDARWLARQWIKAPKAQPSSAVALWHKSFGLAATAALFATAIIGDKNVLDTLSNKLPPQPWLTAHHALIITSSALYLGAQITGWLDPLRLKNPKLAFWVRLLRIVHTVGFASLLALGLLNARLFPGATTGKLVASLAHAGVGYITIGALGLSSVLLFF